MVHVILFCNIYLSIQQHQHHHQWAIYDTFPLPFATFSFQTLFILPFTKVENFSATTAAAMVSGATMRHPGVVGWFAPVSLAGRITDR